MIDQRPQYGELATPEEQRRAAGLPPLSEVESVEPVAPVASEAAPAAAPRRPVDRFATVVLLAYGLVNVITAGLSYLDFGRVMTEVMKVMGIDGEFTNYDQGRIWGTVAAIALVIGWCLTAVISLRRLRQGKLTWWVPLVGAAVTLLVTSVFAAIPLMGDPAFIAYLESMTTR